MSAYAGQMPSPNAAALTLSAGLLGVCAPLQREGGAGGQRLKQQQPCVPRGQQPGADRLLEHDTHEPYTAWARLALLAPESDTVRARCGKRG